MFTLFRKKSDKEYKLGIDAPILVYQMGKVGSISVYWNLLEMELDVPVYHCHALAMLVKLEKQVGVALPNPETHDPHGTIEGIREYRKIYTEFKRSKKRWNVVSLVRDPVARNISAFFQAIPERIPDFYDRLERGAIDTEFLTEVFLKDDLTNQCPLVWIRHQLQPVVGIDIYRTPFPTDRGYEIYEGKKARLLFIRLEDYTEKIEEAMNVYLNIPEFSKHRAANTADEKEYAEVYKRFVKEVVLPQPYLDRIYKSEFANHFYTPEEISRFRAKWAREAPRSAEKPQQVKA